MAQVLALVRSRIPNSTSYCKLISQINTTDKTAPFSCLLHSSLMDSQQPPPLPTAMEVQTIYFSAFAHITSNAKEGVTKIMVTCHCFPSFLDCDACEKF